MNKKRFEKIYIEITNICNLDCSFCPGHQRPPRSLSEKEFSYIIERAAPLTRSVFFHLMGEPTLHPLVGDFIKKSNKLGLKCVLTTNGTLLDKRGKEIISSLPHRVNISLHSFEANETGNFGNYIKSCLDFAESAAAKGIFCILRLWNGGGKDRLNNEILTIATKQFGNQIIPTDKGIRIADRIFIEYGDKFDWQLPEAQGSESGFCLGLRDQIGILSNGNVVPCCLDNNSEITLGNIFDDALESIIVSERAKKIIEGFSKRIAVEEKCKRCGYRHIFD